MVPDSRYEASLRDSQQLAGPQVAGSRDAQKEEEGLDLEDPEAMGQPSQWVVAVEVEGHYPYEHEDHSWGSRCD
jgi:hypothetical protein